MKGRRRSRVIQCKEEAHLLLSKKRLCSTNRQRNADTLFLRTKLHGAMIYSQFPREQMFAYRFEKCSPQTWICSISSGANSFCPSPPKNSFRSPPVLPSTSRSMKKSRSCSTPEIKCYNCVNNGYGSKKFMIYLISTRHLYLATLPLPCSSLCCFILTFSKKKFKIMT